MTQHDDTGTATNQPDQPAYPSPYLDSAGSPQAYLAPPQPGQPRYGVPPVRGPDLPQPGSARQGGPATRRDPAIAAPWERLASSVLDWIIIAAVATLAYISPLLQFLRQLQAVATHYSGQNSPVTQAALNAVFRDPSNHRALLFWRLTMFGIALAYYWFQHAAWGATIGKRALGIRVVTATDHSPIGVRAAGIRTVAFLLGPAACLLLPNPVKVAGGLLWLADTGLTMFDTQAQCLHDKLARTTVIRQRWLDHEAGSSSSPW